MKRMAAVLFWGWLAFGLVLAVQSRTGMGAADATSAYAIPVFVVGIWGLIRAVINHRWVKPVALVVYSCLLFYAGIAANQSIISAHEENFRPLLAALERYKSDHGKYPDRLDKLVPEYVSTLPRCPDDRYGSGNKYYSLMQGDSARIGDQYVIDCVMGVFVFPQLATYESDIPGWMYGD